MVAVVSIALRKGMPPFATMAACRRWLGEREGGGALRERDAV